MVLHSNSERHKLVVEYEKLAATAILTSYFTACYHAVIAVSEGGCRFCVFLVQDDSFACHSKFFWSTETDRQQTDTKHNTYTYPVLPTTPRTHTHSDTQAHKHRHTHTCTHTNNQTKHCKQHNQKYVYPKSYRFLTTAATSTYLQGRVLSRSPRQKSSRQITQVPSPDELDAVSFCDHTEHTNQ